MTDEMRQLMLYQVFLLEQIVVSSEHGYGMKQVRRKRLAEARAEFMPTVEVPWAT